MFLWIVATVIAALEASAHDDQIAGIEMLVSSTAADGPIKASEDGGMIDQHGGDIESVGGDRAFEDLFKEREDEVKTPSLVSDDDQTPPDSPSLEKGEDLDALLSDIYKDIDEDDDYLVWDAETGRHRLAWQKETVIKPLTTIQATSDNNNTSNTSSFTDQHAVEQQNHSSLPHLIHGVESQDNHELAYFLDSPYHHNLQHDARSYVLSVTEETATEEQIDASFPNSADQDEVQEQNSSDSSPLTSPPTNEAYPAPTVPYITYEPYIQSDGTIINMPVVIKPAGCDLLMRGDGTYTVYHAVDESQGDGENATNAARPWWIWYPEGLPKEWRPIPRQTWAHVRFDPRDEDMNLTATYPKYLRTRDSCSAVMTVPIKHYSYEDPTKNPREGGPFLQQQYSPLYTCTNSADLPDPISEDQWEDGECCAPSRR